MLIFVKKVKITEAETKNTILIKQVCNSMKAIYFLVSQIARYNKFETARPYIFTLHLWL